MKAEQKIRAALLALDIYPESVINACHVYKNWEGWKIQKFGEVPWNAGRTLFDVLDGLRDIAESRRNDQ